MEFDLFGTLTIACLVLLLGFYIVKKIKFLRDFNIPEPVVGGFIIAFILYLLYHFFGLQFKFEGSLQTSMMLIFFTSIGLSADFLRLKAGGKPLIIFVILAGILIALQNVFGVSLAKMLGLSPAYGLIAGSVTLTGGHGTGAAWADVLNEAFHVNNSMELAMACATYGLVMGGIIGGPTAKYLLKKKNIKPKNELPDSEKAEEEFGLFSNPKIKDWLNVHTFVETLAMFAICLYVGQYLYGLSRGTWFELPNFVWSLFIGILIRNFLTHLTPYHVSDNAVDLIGNVGLYLFLTVALMSLQLWQLAGLGGPILLILVLQTFLIILYAIVVTYRFMGRDYDAIVLAAGHCGFGLGATPTAVANMQAITERFGASYKAFLIVPMVGAFFIDIINTIFIKLFINFFS